jgi:hypothetical protein
MTDLQLSIEKFSPPVVVAADLTTAFKDFFAQMEQWEEKAATLIVEDETQIGLMFEAGVARKALASIRIAVEKQRKVMKEDSLRTGQAIDGVAKMMRERIEAMEAHLAAQENFIVNREAARVEALRVERYALILPYLVPEILPTPWPEWGTMHKADFENTLAFAIDKARQIEAERVARIEKEKAEKEELERLRVENERQARELEEVNMERQEAEDKIHALKLAEARKEQEEAHRLRAEVNARLEQERIAAQAPDREKLRAFGVALLQVPCAPIQDPAMRKVLQDVKILLTKVNDYIEKKIAQ